MLAPPVVHLDALTGSGLESAPDHRLEQQPVLRERIASQHEALRHIEVDERLCGRTQGRRYLSQQVIRRFFTLDSYDNYLGWMRPAETPVGSFSHTGFTGTYVLGVPRLRLSVVLFTNRQNMGTDARGYFPDLAPLQAAVTKVLTRGLLQ